MEKKSEDAMAAMSREQTGAGDKIGEPKPTTAPLTPVDNAVLDAAQPFKTNSPSEPAKLREADTNVSEEKLSMLVVDDQSRTPTSEYPSTVPTPATSWTSQEFPPQAQDFQPGGLGTAQHSASHDGCYFATRVAPSSSAANLNSTPLTATLPSESRTGSIGDRLDSVSAPQSPGGQWRDNFSLDKFNDNETPRPTSVPTNQVESHSRNRPNYPNQSFAALQAQHIAPHYPRPRPLRTRSSHPSQHQSYSADATRRSREFPSMPGIAKTAGNTPAQSPGLFSPTFSPSRSTEEHEDGQYNTPLLHPSHMQAPKEYAYPPILLFTLRLATNGFP